MDGFRRLLPDLKANFLERFPYPVTLFYSPFEGAQQDLQEFRDLLGDTPVEAVSLPSFGRENFYPPLRDNYSSFENPCRTDAAFHKGGHCSWYHFSYKQMNYIFMYAMFFDTPALSKYRYWLRVDAEIWLTEPIIEDPFALMARSDWVFSYRLEPQMKNVACNRDLPAAVRSFAESRGIEPRDRGFFERYLNGTACFIGNIGAGQVSFFRSEKYRSLVEFVLGTGNVWTLRWDDQHMYAMAVALFSTGEHIGRLPIRVCHRVEDDCDHHLEPSLAARQAARGSGARGGPPS
ncbi:unnamed protein product [Prorocentrum cordatum]|uniref:Mannosyltransferase n=1 Tax=Prorocentrum cordatum TaxID=2364126 RepID=A0ABN9V0T4_9DINO|nr:unnamed protein product [Polarella glacialis]